MKRKTTLSRQQAEQMAQMAFDAYSAMRRTESREADLRSNPYWEALRDTAHARFRAIYLSEAMK